MHYDYMFLGGLLGAIVLPLATIVAGAQEWGAASLGLVFVGAIIGGAIGAYVGKLKDGR